MSDGTIDIELKLDSDKAEKDLDKRAKKLGDSFASKLNESMEKGGRSAGETLGKGLGETAKKSGDSAGKTIGQSITAAIGKVGFDPIAKGLEKAAQSADKVGTSLTNKITKPAMVAASAIGGIVIGSGFARLTAIDTAKAKLEGLGNTAESVTAIMQNATTSVKGTAFSLGEAATAAGMAVASGVSQGKELTNYLSTVANTAAVAGVSMESMGANIGQVFATGAAYLGDLNKMVTAGIPIFEMLAGEMHVTTAEVKDMASKGEISSEVFLRALDRNLGSAATIAARTGMAVSDVNAMLDSMAEDGVASFEELNEITEKGVDAFDLLSKSLGLTKDEIKQLAIDGQISSEHLKDAFDSGLGGAAKVIGEKSLQGAISNVGASIARVGANFLDAGGKGEGFFSQIKPLLVEFMGYLDGVESEAKNWGESFGKAFADAVNFLRQNAGVFKEFGADLGRNFSELTQIVSGFAKDFQKWFRALPKSTQDFIMKLALIGPAASIAFGPFLKLLNPILKLVGKVVGSVGGLASNLVRVGGATGAMSAVATKFSDMGGKAGIAAKGVGALKGGLVALGIAAAALAVGALVKYVEHLKDVEKATTGLTKSTDSFARSFSSFKGIDTSGLDDASTSMVGYRDEINKTIESQAELAQANSETWSDIGTDTALLMGYIDTIERLAGNTEGSTEKQNELALAVAGVNEITGSSYSIIDATRGILDVSTEALKRNTDQWIENAKAQAAQEQMVELQGTLLKQKDDQALAAEALRLEEEKLSQAYEDQANGIYLGEGAIAGHEAAVAEAQKTYDETTASIQATEDQIKRLGDIHTETSAKIALSTETLAGYIAANEGIKTGLESSGKSVEGFAGSLSELQITQEELNQLTPEQLSEMVTAWDGSTASIEGILAGYRSNMTYSLDTLTREAVDGLVGNLEYGQKLSGEQIALLKEAVENPMSDMKMSVDDESRAAMEALVANLSTAEPLTAEQAALIKDALGIATSDLTMSDDVQAEVDAANNAIAAGSPIVGLSSTGFSNAIKNPLAELPGYGTTTGAGLTGNTASSIGAGVEQVSIEANRAGDATEAINKHGNSAGTWGGHLIEAFAGGISGAISASLVPALNEAAAMIEGKVGFSIPKMEPLRNSGKGVAEWGQHMIEEWSQGAKDAMPTLESVLNEVTDKAHDALTGDIGVMDLSIVAPDIAEIYGTDAFRTAVNASNKTITNNYTLIVNGMVFNDDERMTYLARQFMEYAFEKGGQ